MEQLLLATITVGGIYALLTLGLNVQLGYAGLINFGVVAYFTAGAYAYVILVQPAPTGADSYKFGFALPIWVGLIGAGLAAVAFALITGWPCLRLRGEYLALTTFAFAEVFGSLITNTTSVTNGTLGFFGIQQPFSSVVSGPNYPWLLAALIVIALVATFVIVQRITSSPFGMALKAIRDDEVAAVQAGKNVRRLRLQAFLIGSVAYGFAGAVYAWYTTVVSPGQFDADITFTVFIALIIGGIGSNLGAILGALLLVGSQEVVASLAMNPVIAEKAGSVQAALEGLLFLIILRVAPGGAASLFRRRQHIHEDAVEPLEPPSQPLIPSEVGSR